MIAALRERSAGELIVPEGAVYPALHRLEAAGLLGSFWAERAGRRRRLYELTARGGSVLADLQGERRRFSTGVQAAVGVGVSADPVEGYLDRLLGHLRGSAHDVRRILSEAEEHLRDATVELVAAGASEEQAQRRAVERFGSPRTVARRFSACLAPVPPAAVAGELARVAVVLGGVGLVAELLGRLFGAGFVAGALPGVTYIPARCAEFLEYFPDAGGCAQAAALHHWGEVVEYRAAVGVVGAFVLGGFLLWRRRADRQDPRYLGVLPDGFAATVATSLYGAIAAALAVLSLDAFLVGGGDGTGQWLSGAIVAVAMAAVYGVSLYRTVLTRARPGAATFPLDPARSSN